MISTPMLRRALKQVATLGVNRAPPVREALAGRYLRGTGLEIGALNAPMWVPMGVTVRYVDRLPTEQLREQYPELRDIALPNVDVVCDGEMLTPVRSHSVNFVVANHVLEHCQNPLRTIQEWLRVVNDDGIVFMAIPDKRLCFDAERPATPLAHVVDEFEHGAEKNERGHVEEWVTHVEKVPEAERAARVDALLATKYSIHYHAWSWSEIVELLAYARDRLGLSFEVEALQRNGLEVVAVLRKRVR